MRFPWALLAAYIAAASILVYILYRYMAPQRIPAKEGFTAAAAAVTACPPGSSPYYSTKDGNTYCCRGEVKGNQCNTDPLCVMRQTAEKGVPPCAEVYEDYIRAQTKIYCPSTMQTYIPAGAEGDTAQCRDPATGRSCTVYASAEENDARADSCQNQRALEEAPCTGDGCTKALISPNGRNTFVSVHYTGGDGKPHVCYDRATYEAYLDATRPDWRREIETDDAIFCRGGL